MERRSNGARIVAESQRVVVKKNPGDGRGFEGCIRLRYCVQMASALIVTVPLAMFSAVTTHWLTGPLVTDDAG